MSQVSYYPDWREKIIFSAQGPQPQVLAESAQIKSVIAGLDRPAIPPTPGRWGYTTSWKAPAR